MNRSTTRRVMPLALVLLLALALPLTAQPAREPRASLGGLLPTLKFAFGVDLGEDEFQPGSRLVFQRSTNQPLARLGSVGKTEVGNSLEDRRARIVADHLIPRDRHRLASRLHP